MIRFTKQKTVLQPKIIWLVALFFSVPYSASAGELAFSFKDKDGTAIADVVAYAESSQTMTPQTSTGNAAMDQIDKEFVPYVMAIRTGTAVSFPNKDNIRHHVYSFSKPKTFELKLYSGVPSKPVIFDKPGVVALGCNIHDWMVGYLMILDTPWFGQSDSNGKARINDLPAGQYQLKFWHPDQMAEIPARSVTVSANSKDDIIIELGVKPRPLPAF
jgi:plastocyanin